MGPRKADYNAYEIVYDVNGHRKPFIDASKMEVSGMHSFSSGFVRGLVGKQGIVISVTRVSSITYIDYKIERYLFQIILRYGRIIVYNQLEGFKS